MRVITYTEEDLKKTCRELAYKYKESFPLPDIVVGIRNGGWYVANNMLPCLKPAALGAVIQKRRTSSMKGKLTGMILRHLPEAATNRLRIIEHRILTKNIPLPDDIPLPDLNIDLPQDTGEIRRILIVDDAVDSGRTLWIAKEVLQRRFPEADIHTAVLTVTTTNPVIRPDVALYRNGTLIRFPWAADAN